MANNGGGFTNNFISLKTLVERLQYGRDQLVRFWEKELEIIRKAMGFRYKAHIQFDRTSLSDEAAEKNLLIQLADRDIISHETLLERFKEIPQIENIRMKRELTKRDSAGPPKAGPFHPPPPPPVPTDNTEQKPSNDITPTDESENGRPLFKKDDGPRKQRVEQPRSKPGLAKVIVRAEKTWSHISETITNAYLKSLDKKNLRQLNKAQFRSLEQLKLDVFTNINIEQDISDDIICAILKSKTKTPASFMGHLRSNQVTLDEMNIDDYRKHVIGLYVEHLY